MTDRQLKIVIKTEIQKGFGEVSKQLGDLTKSLQGLSGIQSSLNALVSKFDSQGTFKAAAQNAQKLSQAQKAVNDQVNAGIRLASQARSEQEKLLSNLAKVNAAEKAGKISAEQRLTAEIKLTTDLIKKTSDLSILQAKGGRNARGQFTSAPLSKEAVKAIQATTERPTGGGVLTDPREYEARYKAISAAIDNGSTQVKTALQKQIEEITNVASNSPWANISKNERSELAKYYKGLEGSIDQGSNEVVKGIDVQAARIRNAMDRMIAPNAARGQERTRTQNMYNSLFGAAPEEPSRKPMSESYKNLAAFASGGNFGGGAGGSGGGRGFGVPDSAFESINKLTKSYTQLGRTLFELQYSTYTLFAVSGLEALNKLNDKAIDVKNTVARTSRTPADISGNVDAVYDISRKTYTDPEDTAKLYARINSYSKSLNLDNGQVNGIAGNLQGLIGAGSLNQAMKTRSTTELAELLSGQGGGRQLQALSRENQLIIPLVQEYLGKKQGMPDGQVPAITGKGAVKLTPKDFLDTFDENKNAGIDKKVFDINNQKDRTSGDVSKEFTSDLTKYISDAKDNFGILQEAINGLAHFLSDYTKFSNFMHAIEDATVALTVLGTAALANSAAKGIGSGIGLVSNFGKAINLEKSATAAGGIAASLGKSAAEGSEFVDAAMLAEHVKNATRLETELAATTEKLGGPLSKLVPIFAGTATGAEVLAASMLGVGLVVGAVVIVVALIAARFNELLRRFGDGITIFDIIVGLWKELSAGASAFGKVADNALGGLFSGILKMLDNVLKWVIGKAKANDYIRGAEMQNKYGLSDYKTTGEGTATAKSKSGIQYMLKTNTEKGDNYGNLITDKHGNPLVYNAKGQNIKDANGNDQAFLSTKEQNNRKLYSGFSAGASNDEKGPKDPGANPYASISNTILEAQKEANGIIASFNENDAWASLDKAVSSKTDGIEKSINEAASKLGSARTKELRDSLAELTATLTNAELAKGVRKFNDDISKLQSGITKKAYDSRLAGNSAQVDSYNRSALEDLFKAPGYTNKATATPDLLSKILMATDDSLANKGADNVDVVGKKFHSLIPSKSDNFDVIELAKSLGILTDEGIKAAGGLQAFRSKITEINQKEYMSGTRDLNTKRGITEVTNGLYGENRNRQQSYFSEIQDFKSKFATSDQDPNLIAARLKEVQASYIALDKYNADWQNGAKEAIADYSDSLKNLAGEIKDTFSHAFDNMTTALVGFLQTGRLNLRNFVNGILTDVETTAVKQLIMTPVTDALKNSFGMKDASPTSALASAAGLSPIDANTKALNTLTDAINGKSIGANGATNALGGTNPLSALGGLGNNSTPILNADGSTFYDGSPLTTSLPDITMDGSAASSGGGLFSSLGSLFSGGMGGIGSMLSQLTSGLTGGLGSLLGGLGGLAGGAAGGIGSFFSSILPFFALFHDGGIVGSSGGMSRQVNPSVFQGARRYHTGGIAGLPSLGANEVPAILKQGEQVLTVPQQVAMNSKLKGSGNQQVFSPQVSLTYNAGNGQNDSPEDAKKMSDLINGQIEKKYYELTKSNLSPGGALYNAMATPR